MSKPEVLIRKIISGGQTGVDYGALLGARQLGIPTGGTAPKGFLTERGPKRILGTVFGLVEHESEKYPPRTQQNVNDADATLVIHVEGVHSPGTLLTRAYCIDLEKPWTIIKIHDLHDPKPFVRASQWLEDVHPGILNVAGDRESSVPGITDWTRLFVVGLFESEGGNQ